MDPGFLERGRRVHKVTGGCGEGCPLPTVVAGGVWGGAVPLLRQQNEI